MNVLSDTEEEGDTEELEEARSKRPATSVSDKINGNYLFVILRVYELQIF